MPQKAGNNDRAVVPRSVFFHTVTRRTKRRRMTRRKHEFDQKCLCPFVCGRLRLSDHLETCRTPLPAARELRQRERRRIKATKRFIKFHQKFIKLVLTVHIFYCIWCETSSKKTESSSKIFHHNFIAPFPGVWRLRLRLRLRALARASARALGCAAQAPARTLKEPTCSRVDSN